jgi:hypothetical protein
VTDPIRRDIRRAALLVAVVFVAAACGAATSISSPSAAASPSAAITSAPSVSPVPSASPVASPSPSTATACAVTPQTGLLPSDRFTDLKLSTGPAGDVLTFVFGPSSLDSPAGPPHDSLDVATPPYTEAGSAAPIAMAGEHVVAVRFSAMSLQNDAGELMYTGPSQVKPAYPSLRQAVQFDASEGVVGWYVGYDGMGCVTLGQDRNTVTVTIAHS